MEKKDNKNTIKAVILIVLALITIGSIIFGTYRFTGNVKNNIEKVFKEHGISINGFGIHSDDGIDGADGADGDVWYDWEDDFDERYDNNDDFSVKNEPDSITELDAFSKLKINAKVSGISVKTGDKFSYYCKYNKKILKPTVRNKNGTLEIIQNGTKSNNGNLNCYIEVTVPRYTKLDDVDIKINVGEINIENFDCINCDLKNNVGEIDVSNINFDTIYIENNVGEISINTISSIEEYDINLNTNIGEINVCGKNYRHDFSQKGSKSKRIHAKTNIGEINLK